MSQLLSDEEDYYFQIADELEEVPETIRPLYEKIKQEMLQ